MSDKLICKIQSVIYYWLILLAWFIWRMYGYGILGFNVPLDTVYGYFGDGGPWATAQGPPSPKCAPPIQ